MKRSIVLVIAGCVLALSAYAGPQAILGGIKGKVEVKPAQGEWIAASEGMKVDLRATVSTGFDSTATITIEKSKIVVKPLTRLTLDKLIEQSSGSVAASMFLRVGSVQASVKATTPGTPQDFKVQSPYSTASVRGTEFEFDGLFLKVTEGIVSLIPGRPVRDIQAPEASALDQGEGQVQDQGQTGQAAAGPAEDPDAGFAGAIPVDAADSSAAVNVRQNQQATVRIAHRMDTGKTAPVVKKAGSPESGADAGGSATTAPSPKPAEATKAGGVTITIATKQP